MWFISCHWFSYPTSVSNYLTVYDLTVLKLKLISETGRIVFKVGKDRNCAAHSFSLKFAERSVAWCAVNHSSRILVEPTHTQYHRSNIRAERILFNN